MDKFSQIVVERIGYYVYGLIDPRDNKLFYIGKGKGNRVFNHEKCAIENSTSNDKLDKIREIHSAGFEVIKKIFGHGYDELTAFAVEAVLIDEHWNELTNEVSGHHTEVNGIKSVEEIEEMYNCPKTILDPNDIFIALNVNRSFDRNNDLYKESRSWWRINTKRANKVDKILIVCKGIVRGVFENSSWTRGKDNKGIFTATENKTHPYLNTDISSIITFNQEPIRYYNC